MDEPLHLDRVLAARQLRVYYQPFVHLDRFEVAGYEALLRWAHPERGILTASEFLGRATSASRDHVGWWTLEVACRQARRWADESVAPRRSPGRFGEPVPVANARAGSHGARDPDRKGRGYRRERRRGVRFGGGQRRSARGARAQGGLVSGVRPPRRGAGVCDAHRDRAPAAARSRRRAARSGRASTSRGPSPRTSRAHSCITRSGGTCTTSRAERGRSAMVRTVPVAVRCCFSPRRVNPARAGSRAAGPTAVAGRTPSPRRPCRRRG